MTGLQACTVVLVVFLCFVCTAASPQDNWHFSGDNIALHKSASQLPETYFDNDQSQKHYPASLAVDGNTDGYFKHGSCSHTKGKSNVDASWTVDLDKTYNITGIIIYNRDDLKIRLKNFQVVANDHMLIHDSAGTDEYKQNILTFELDGLRSFSKITILLPSQHGYSDGGNYYLTLCEVQIYAAPRPACDVRGTYITNGQTQIYHNTGRSINGRYTVGTIIEVNCDENFHPSGPSRLTCLPTDKYDYPIPKCEEACAPILTPSNGRVVPDLLLYMVNTSLKIVCDEGYETDKANIIHCQGGGRWETPIPTCHSVQCLLPRKPKHGYYSVNGHTAAQERLFPYMTEIIGICETGYVSIYPQKRICKSDKTWSDHETICTPVQCSHHQNQTNVKDCIPVMCSWPQHLDNGFYQASNSPSPYGMPYNTTLTATCNDTYKLSDNYRIRRCNEDAVWDKSPAVCYPVCKLPVVSNGQFINTLSTHFVAGTTLRFTCNSGFIAATSEDTITCLKNHQWSAMPVCQDQACILPSLANGQFINTLSARFEAGTTLRFTCNSGFTAKSSEDTITCQQNHQWSAMPVCQESETPNSVVMYIVVSVAVVITVAMIVAVAVFVFRRLHNAAQPQDRVIIVNEEVVQSDEYYSESYDDARHMKY